MTLSEVRENKSAIIMKEVLDGKNNKEKGLWALKTKGSSNNCFKESISRSVVSVWDPMDYIACQAAIYGILQARILKWVAIPFSRGSSWPWDGTQVSRITGSFFTAWVTREV